MNVWDVSDPIRELIRSRRAVSTRDLADADLPLSHLVADPERESVSRREPAEALSVWASEGGSC
jgi:hypothetical protein